MVRPRYKITRFLFYVLACVLICAAFASEVPEQLTLTNDTSNDYTLRSPTFLKSIQALSSVRQELGLFMTTAPPPPSWQSLPTAPDGASIQAQSLLVLHSILRT